MDIILPVGSKQLCPPKPDIKFIPNITLAEVERHYIIAALEFHKSKKTAAKSLGISLKTMMNKIHAFNLFDKYRDRPEREIPDYHAEVNFKNGTWDALTKSEIAVSLLLLKALTNRQIASAVGLSPNSINKYISIIYKKTQVNTRHEFIVKFSKTGQ